MKVRRGAAALMAAAAAAGAPAAQAGTAARVLPQRQVRLALPPYMPPIPAPGRMPAIMPGHQAAADALGTDPEASYYNHETNQIYAGNAWDEASQSFQPTAKIRPFIKAHEIGHALDALYFTDQDRERLRTAMRLKSSKAWFGNPQDLNREVATPAEHFADWYASIVRGINMPGSKRFVSGDYDTQYGGRRAFREFRSILDEIAKRDRLPRYTR